MRKSAASLSLAALISGGGTNLQALIDAVQNRDLAASISVVLSNNADAWVFQRARAAGIPVEILDHGLYANREAYDDALRQVLDGYDPDLIVLAGFMRILSEKFVQRYAGRILNIHPSLLPKYTGLNTHARAIEAGESMHGCAVHFVTPTLDGGPPIIQGAVAIRKGDTPEELAARVLEIEHKIYPEAVSMIAAGRLEYKNEQAWLDGEALTEPVRWLDQVLGSVTPS